MSKATDLVEKLSQESEEFKNAYAESQLQDQEVALQAKENQVSQVEAELEAMRESILSNSETSGTLEADYQAAVKAQKDCEAELKSVRKVRNDAQNKADELDQEVQQMNEHLQDLLEKQAKIEATASRYEVSIDNHLTHLREEYGLTCKYLK